LIKNIISIEKHGKMEELILLPYTFCGSIKMMGGQIYILDQGVDIVAGI
jgi:hypothetical protein